MTRLALRAHSLAFDATNSYLPAAHDLLRGNSPYHPAGIARGVAFASPPIAGYLFAPFTAMPHPVAEAAIATMMLAAVLGALLVAGVRDWRCLAIAAISVPFVEEVQTANLSAIVALLTALLWRCRERAAAAGAAAGLSVGLKLFGWPMIVFLVATRRFRAATWAIAVAAASIFLPWACIRFAGLREYPHLLHSLEIVERGEVYSVGALIARVASWTVAGTITYIVVALLLIVAWRSGSNNAQAFVACLGATLAATPILWMHYFVLLLLAIAVVSPRISTLWALPFALWISSSVGPAHAWQAVFVLLVESAVLLTAFRHARAVGPNGGIASKVPTGV